MPEPYRKMVRSPTWNIVRMEHRARSRRFLVYLSLTWSVRRFRRTKGSEIEPGTEPPDGSSGSAQG